ncbi:MAG: amidohydrolase [Lewinellaceae bacterium]|nr:amidohydrolase [Lewinellaceae bacterium]
MRTLLTICCLLPFFFAGATPEPPVVRPELIKEDLSYLLGFYKQLHQSPEVSLEEKETSAKLARELRSIGFTVTEQVGGYGIVGIYKNGEGPTILYRTDMDALPMIEKTGLDYASQKMIEQNGSQTGVMHSCGHDMHMTTWLGTARAMVRMKDQWKGTLMLIGQPAEEIGAGSKLMLDAGLYERFGVPKYGVGLHCSPTIPAGQVGFGKGFTMANSESIDIKVFGIGAHGASPHMSIDPVVISSMIIMDLQTIVSRNLKPIESAVITVGAIKGGTKHNIIPDEVTLQLTVRTFKQEVRDMVHRRIKEVCRGIAIAAGLPEDKMPEVIIPEGFTPANYNNPDLVDRLSASAAKAIGAANVIDAEVQMVAEDFSRYGQTKHQVPTVLYWLGTVPDERLQKQDLPGLHSPFYYPAPEKSLETGILVTCQGLIDLFKS